MICELIALSCLTVHGDVPATKAKRLTKAYNADQIVEESGTFAPPRSIRYQVDRSTTKMEKWSR